MHKHSGTVLVFFDFTRATSKLLFIPDLIRRMNAAVLPGFRDSTIAANG